MGTYAGFGGLLAAKTVIGERDVGGDVKVIKSRNYSLIIIEPRP